MSVSGVSGKEKCVEDVGTIEIMDPVITDMSSTSWVCGETVTVTGDYFGMKPKIWVSCTDCKGKAAKRSCKLVSCAFDASTGASSLDFIVQKVQDGRLRVRLLPFQRHWRGKLDLQFHNR